MKNKYVEHRDVSKHVYYWCGGGGEGEETRETDRDRTREGGTEIYIYILDLHREITGRKMIIENIKTGKVLNENQISKYM